MVSTLRRWRLFRPWMEKPCSRVLRKLSGELTTIQYWAARPPPDFRLRRDLPDLAGRASSGGGESSEFSDDTHEDYWPFTLAGRTGPRSWGSGSSALRFRIC